MQRVQIHTTEPPVDYIDVVDGIGDRVARIRRSADGRVTVRTYESRSASLSADEALELAAAIGRL